VATGIGLDELIARLRTVGGAELVGASFAVVKWHAGDLAADVALPRRERSIGSRHRDFAIDAAGPEVPLRDDLARRDFRMNMIARALPDGALVDPYGGEADIRARRIDLLRPGAFDEDPLRMLRAVQFAARFGYTLTPDTVAALRVAAPLAATVSRERVRDELVKLLGDAPRPSEGFEVMRETGLLVWVLPELLEGVEVEQNEWHRFDVYRHALAALDATPPGDVTLRLAALLHDIGKPRCKDGPRFYNHDAVGEEMSRRILERLRFSGEIVDTVKALVRHHLYLADPQMRPATIRRFIRRVGSPRLERLFALRHADIVGTGLPPIDDRNQRFQERVWATLRERPPLGIRDLAVDGNDARAALSERGLLGLEQRGDARIGKLLDAVLEAVLEEPGLDRSAQLTLLGREADRLS
jgi:tRNA nucleotidyltransferase (CCA-adding enzyme)